MVYMHQYKDPTCNLKNENLIKYDIYDTITIWFKKKRNDLTLDEMWFGFPILGLAHLSPSALWGYSIDGAI